MKQPNPGKPIVLTGGPTSDAGKAVSSRNATKHGCCSTETLILPSESHEEFKSLQSAWFRTYEPQAAAEVHLVYQLAEADWFLQRSTRTVAEVEHNLFTATPNAAEWTEVQQKTLTRFLRYQTTRSNLVIKRQKAVEDYRKNRAAEVTRTQAAKDKAEKLNIAKAKLKTYQTKNAPESSWAEHLEGMRRQAISLGYTPPPNPMLK